MLSPDIKALLQAIAQGDAASQGVLADACEEMGDSRANKVRLLQPQPVGPDWGCVPLQVAQDAGLATEVEFTAGMFAGQWRLTQCNGEPLFWGPPGDRSPQLVLLCECSRHPDPCLDALDYPISARYMDHHVLLSSYDGTPYFQPQEHNVFWVGQCAHCRRVHWSWNRWPRPEDIAAGVALVPQRLLNLFPEYGVRLDPKREVKPRASYI